MPGGANRQFLPVGTDRQPSMSQVTESLRIVVNGEERHVPPGTRVADLVRASKLSPDQVAVEVNRRLVRAAQYDRELAEGDAVEIVTFVGGG